ncbi:mechanosensitive ion channel domain-containing protein [Cellulomonas pakistanensis]|uniref:mechanosensitive ion channel domain-containing protein n=1 Tax=Cellulomonas pakistanensis TaxID=992287 RepID=UPI001EF3B2D0|nr:mechanosensitive ion channel domain-containing protein [Cellulomonas pakistanensis]
MIRSATQAAVQAATTEEAVDTARDVLVPVLWVAGAVLVALLVAVLIGAAVRTVAKKSVLAADLAKRSRRPLRAVLIVIAVWVALAISVSDADWETSWMRAVGHVLLIALIAATTWLVGTLAFVVEDLALSRYRVDVKDNRHARRVRTQVQLLRRITVAVLVIVGVAAVLLTFPGVSAFGASLLASAGLLSVVAGLAAQSSLANVFAGLQIAFTDGIRVDDVVIVEEEWGRIEEITLTYVVVHIWDDRRLILPSTYFTQTPFENWTRRAAELLGTVEIDVDWQVPVDELRAELNRLLADTDLWDHRVGILQVTDAVNGVVRLRALASAVDAPTLFDLRCYLREGLVAYLQRNAPQGLPRTRIETTKGAPLPVEAPAPAQARRPRTGAHAVVEPAPETGQLDARLFTGSVEAMQRAGSFAGPGEDVIAEREEHAAEARQDAETTAGRSSGGRKVAVVPAPGTDAVPVAVRTAGVTEADAVPVAPATGAESGAAEAGATGAAPASIAPAEGPDRAEEPAAAGEPGRVEQPAPASEPARADEPARAEERAAADDAPAAVPTGAARTSEPMAGRGDESGTMVLPAYADPATAAIPPVAGTSRSTGETQVQPAVRPDGAGGATDDARDDAPSNAPDAEGTPAPPTRRSVRSAPLDPRDRPSR